MKIAVILGNRMNDDGSLSKTCLHRVELAKRAAKLFEVDYLILSGGTPNKKAGISEAEAMKNKLVQDGFDEKKLIIEKNSNTTVENAGYSVPMAAAMNADEIVLVTSVDHFGRWYYNPVKIFKKALAAYPKIKLTVFAGE